MRLMMRGDVLDELPIRGIKVWRATMVKKVIVSGLLGGVVLIVWTGFHPKPEQPSDAGTLTSDAAPSQAAHDELVDLFFAWRQFHSPNMIDDVPDYTIDSMERQHRELADLQSRLAAIDTIGWSIAHQIDWYLVWAEMNGFDFAHRVKKP